MVVVQRRCAVGGWSRESVVEEERRDLLARLDSADAVIVAAPRLTARLTGFDGRFPLGPSVWGDTRISLDPGLAGAYRDRFSGLRISTEWRDGMLTLPAGALFGSLPVAMLLREGKA